MTKLHHVEMIIVDHEGYGVDDIMNSLPDNYSFNLLSYETVNIEWSDDNPINQKSTTKDDIIAEFESHRTCTECHTTGVIVSGCCSGYECGCRGLPTNVYRSNCGCQLKGYDFIETVYGDVVKHLDWEESAIIESIIKHD